MKKKYLYLNNKRINKDNQNIINYNYNFINKIKR